ncbi:MAG: LicD family protein [Spirochaetaceae bacterium]|nr:LicD family protein [Spirochaetaceae bacterium]
MRKTVPDFDSTIPDLRPQGDTPLRCCQMVMLRLLKIFDKVCFEAGLSYWLDAGTLLGAVRHGGFIPWDDDVDVSMPIDDYRRFLQVAPSLLPYDVFLQTKGSDPAHGVPWAKLRDRFSFMDDPGGPYSYAQGIPMDITPMRVMSRRRHVLRKLFELMPPYDCRPRWPEARWSLKHKVYSGAFALLQAAARPLLRRGPLGRALVRYGEGGDRVWAYEPPIEWMQSFPEEIVLPLSSIRFEDTVFPCPADPRRYLELYFGQDYMTPPPDSKRGAHAVPRYMIMGPNPHPSALCWDDYREKKAAAAEAAASAKASRA